MQCYCNSWRVRNLLVIVLRLNKSLKYHELIPTPDSWGPAPTFVPFYSDYSTPRMSWTMPEKTPPRCPEFHAERSSPQTAGDFNISNYTIRYTFKLHSRRIWPFAVRLNALIPLSVVNSMLTKIQSKTWTHFPTSNTLTTSQTRSLNHHHHLLRRGWHNTPAPALRWAIALLSHWNATLRVSLRRTSKTIPTTPLWRVKSTNISSVGWRRRAWRRTMTTCWRKKTPLCVSQASKTGIASRSSWLACQMICLSGSGNYTLSRIWNGMTITNAISTTGVDTSSKAWDGWWGSQHMPSIVFTPLSVALTAIRHWNASILKCTLRTGGGRHRKREIFEYDDMLTDVKSMLRVRDTLVPLILMSDGTHLSNFAGDRIE